MRPIDTVKNFLGGWTPSPSDIQWVDRLLKTLNDGGKWGSPGMGTVYTVDHTGKRLILEEGPLDQMFYRTQLIAHKLGYTVLKRSDIPRPENN